MKERLIAGLGDAAWWVLMLPSKVAFAAWNAALWLPERVARAMYWRP